MARPKKVDTDTASIVENEKKTIEETTVEKPVEAQKEEVQDEPKPEEEKKPSKTVKKKFGDDDKVIIKCAAYAGKSIILPTRTIELDEKGNCEVTGLEAKRLLTIPGYELA